jgi:hypothetical protein
LLRSRLPLAFISRAVGALFPTFEAKPLQPAEYN